MRPERRKQHRFSPANRALGLALALAIFAPLACARAPQVPREPSAEEYWRSIEDLPARALVLGYDDLGSDYLNDPDLPRNGRLFVIDSDGTVSECARGEIGLGDLVGDRVLYSNGPNLYETDTSCTQATILASVTDFTTEDPGGWGWNCPRLSPDGSKISAQLLRTDLAEDLDSRDFPTEGYPAHQVLIDPHGAHAVDSLRWCEWLDEEHGVVNVGAVEPFAVDLATGEATLLRTPERWLGQLQLGDGAPRPLGGSAVTTDGFGYWYELTSRDGSHGYPWPGIWHLSDADGPAVAVTNGRLPGRCDPSWSIDGKHALFQVKGGTVAVSADGVARWRGGKGCYVWLGTTHVLRIRRDEVSVVSLVSGDSTPLTLPRRTGFPMESSLALGLSERVHAALSLRSQALPPDQIRTITFDGVSVAAPPGWSWYEGMGSCDFGGEVEDIYNCGDHLLSSVHPFIPALDVLHTTKSVEAVMRRLDLHRPCREPIEKPCQWIRSISQREIDGARFTEFRVDDQPYFRETYFIGAVQGFTVFISVPGDNHLSDEALRRVMDTMTFDF